MLTFSAVLPDEARDAYQWHRGFSASKDSLYPRSQAAFKAVVDNGSAWSARDSNADYLALAYANFDEVDSTWELGGLMVATSRRGQGLGAALMRLALGNTLFEENPLELNQKIVAHVLKSNPDPRKIIQHSLKFRFAGSVTIPSHVLPGLKANAEGFIEGDEFHFTMPDSLDALVEWVNSWDGKLRDQEAEIILRPGVSLKHWAKAFGEMASAYS
jgi:Acetyltransferase (GNAT) family